MVPYFQTAPFWFRKEYGIPHMIAADSILDCQNDNNPWIFREIPSGWFRNGRGQATMQTWEAYQQTHQEIELPRAKLLAHGTKRNLIVFQKGIIFLSAKWFLARVLLRKVVSPCFP